MRSSKIVNPYVEVQGTGTLGSFRHSTMLHIHLNLARVGNDYIGQKKDDNGL